MKEKGMEQKRQAMQPHTKTLLLRLFQGVSAVEVGLLFCHRNAIDVS